MGLKWTDIEDIAIALYERFPDIHPLTVRFTDLYKWIIEIPNFDDDPRSSNEKKLETIQQAWYEEYRNS
jgi:FeS assembly protein IscX